jgi:putative addiction module killer protein
VKKIRRTSIYRAWFEAVRDYRAKIRIKARINRLKQGNPGDNRFLGEIVEMRIDYGPGYRVYYKDTGQEIIIPLCGGDKSNQQSDINKAKQLARTTLIEETEEEV